MAVEVGMLPKTAGGWAELAEGQDHPLPLQKET